MADNPHRSPSSVDPNHSGYYVQVKLNESGNLGTSPQSNAKINYNYLPPDSDNIYTSANNSNSNSNSTSNVLNSSTNKSNSLNNSAVVNGVPPLMNYDYREIVFEEVKLDEVAIGR
jgi:hypothetical protein